VPSPAWSSEPESPPGPEPLRLFLAINAPPPVVAALRIPIRPLPGLAWTRPEQLHLTLLFLGSTAPAQVPTLRKRLRSVRSAPFVLAIEGLGVFPQQGRPNVLWCGVGAGVQEIHQLRRRIDDALSSLGIGTDSRPFVPHVTLARLGPAAQRQLPDWLRLHHDLAAPPFQADRFTLYSSRLNPTGAVHTAIEEYPLRA